MTHLARTLWLFSTLVVLCGCGETTRRANPTSGPSSSPPSGPPSPPSGPAPQGLNIAGNWQFRTTSTVSTGIPPATIAGSITQSGGSLKGAVHIDGWSCFDQRTTIGLTGTLTDSNVSLTSISVDGQVITIAGSISKNVLAGPYDFTGTYAINGGCATGEQGDVSGIGVDSITGNWGGNLTTAGGRTIHVVAQLTQGSASPEGSFGLAGTVTFDDVCLKSGTIASGTFPSASFIMGRSVVLEIKTDNGTIAFLATADPDGLIRGNYTVSAGPCEPTGTGYLSPWEY